MALPLIAKLAAAGLLGGGILFFAAGSKAATTIATKKMPPALEAEYLRAKANVLHDPKILLVVAAKLEAAGFLAQARELRDLAKTRAIAESPASTPAEKITASAVSAVAKMQAATAAAVTPLQTAAKRLSDHLNLLVKSRGSVTRAKGKEDKAQVQSFQGATGLKTDGLYGPKTANMLGRYYGDVPIVFYWPRGTMPSQTVPTYRSNLETLALEADQMGRSYDTLRAKLLRMSASREKGQGYGSGTAIAPTDKPMTTQEAQQLQAQVAQIFFNS
jgi:peptidoglycan hydrolase-like protein with peptidoglycan-binding domain